MKIVSKEDSKKQKTVMFSELQWGDCFLLKSSYRLDQVLCIKQNDEQYISLKTGTLYNVSTESMMVYAVDAEVSYCPIYE